MGFGSFVKKGVGAMTGGLSNKLLGGGGGAGGKRASAASKRKTERKARTKRIDEGQAKTRAARVTRGETSRAATATRRTAAKERSGVKKSAFGGGNGYKDGGPVRSTKRKKATRMPSY